MVKHVVMWKLSAATPEERTAQAEEIRGALEALRGRIPGMLSLEVGLSPRGSEEESDVVLITTHESWEALAAYQSHPEHQRVVPIIGRLRKERRVVDFEVNDRA